MAKILLLEDDPILGKALKLSLEVASHKVEWAQTIAEARNRNEQQELDLLLFDVNLPDGSGADLCQEIRSSGSRIPIIMLTARADEDSVVDGLTAGANDYMKKPFSNRELLVRIQNALKEPLVRESQLRKGPVLLLIEQRKLLIDNQEIKLNRKEFEIFRCLLTNSGAIMSRENVLNFVKGSEDISDRTIDSHLSHIRTKLKNSNISSVSIKAVYGIGYTLDIQ